VPAVHFATLEGMEIFQKTKTQTLLTIFSTSNLQEPSLSALCRFLAPCVQRVDESVVRAK
jgi:hypothetical protein